MDPVIRLVKFPKYAKMAVMEIIHETINATDLKNTELLLKKTLFVDIETLGFNAAYQPIYMIGTAAIIGDAADITLYFAETEGEEPDILRAFLENAADFDAIFTYNGALIKSTDGEIIDRKSVV